MISLISNLTRFTRCILGQSFPQDLPSIFPYFECFEFEFSFHSISFLSFNRSKHQFWFVRIDETPLQKVNLETFLNCSNQENQNSKKLRFASIESGKGIEKERRIQTQNTQNGELMKGGLGESSGQECNE